MESLDMHKIIKITLGAFLIVLGSAITATAQLTIGEPGELPTGYIHLSPTEVAERVDNMIEAGEITSNGLVRTKSGIILSGTPHSLLIEAGVFYEYYSDCRHDKVYRYDDPYWAEVKGAWMTNWQYCHMLNK